MDLSDRLNKFNSGGLMHLISVIMAARNEEEYIGKSLESLLNQTYPNIEIIVINDGSTDRTEEIVKEYIKKYKNIRLINIEHEREWGCIVPRIIGIENAKEGILFVVDADAYYDKDYVEKCIKYLEEPNVAGAVGRIRVWDPKTWFSKCRDFHYRGRWNDIENIKKEIKEGKIAPWIFKKSVYYEVGGYNPSLSYGEDRDFAIRLLKAGYEIVFVPETEWYHKWEEIPSKVIKTHFRIGVKNYEFIKKNRVEVVKKMYFSALIPLIALCFVKPIFLFLLLAHVSPLYFKALKFLRTADKNRKYALLFPFYIYVAELPASLGFLYAAIIRGYKKLINISLNIL